MSTDDGSEEFVDCLSGLITTATTTTTVRFNCHFPGGPG